MGELNPSDPVPLMEFPFDSTEEPQLVMGEYGPVIIAIELTPNPVSVGELYTISVTLEVAE